nr:RNA-directed DNA polymerase, eukaryota [Tanacetum cinerariifolium]
MIRAKELFAWSSVLNEVKEVEYYTDDESVQGTNKDKGEVSNKVQPNPESDDKGVSDTYFGESEENLGSDISILYPPGFTPEKFNNNAYVHEVKDMNTEPSECRSEGLCSRVLEEIQHTDNLLSSGVRSNGHMLKKGGYVLEVQDEMIKVGQTMGYTMEGCMKDMENIIGSQGAQDMESISEMDVKILWGNSNFEYLFSEVIGNSGGILCTWDPNIFLKEQHILSDNFVALFGTWIPTKTKLLMISIYAPQPRTEKRSLWNYITSLVTRWQGDSIAMGDFNEVRSADEHMGLVFNIQGTSDFNDFISNSGLVDIQLEGYSFTWSHPSASKMSKLDRFLVTEGVILLFPHISAICLDMHLLDHRLILLRDVIADYGATPFRLYHSWLTLSGFKQLVIQTWNFTVLEDSNGMVRFKKKLQALKKAIREWVVVYKREQTGRRNDIKLKLSVIDKQLDQGCVNDDILLSRMGLMKQLLDSNSSDALDNLKKAKIQWAIKGNENSKFFHGACGENKSPGPDGFTFEFFSLIPKVQDPKFINDYRPISLIGSLYKVVTKILALRLSSVIAGLISDVKMAFLLSRQILDGPLVINELLSWYKHKKQHAMIFKVDFAKAYDSVRWDFLDDVLQSFGFCFKWRSWILGSLSSGMASVLVNKSPTAEFQFHYELKQGDPLAPYLFILVMESLHLSFSKVVDASIIKGIMIDNSTMISHLFYADDAVFVGVGIPNDLIVAAASTLGCSIMKTPFKYLGVTVGGNMSNISAWDDIISKLNSRLSEWKVKTLSIGGRLMLLKSVLGSTPIYWMSLYKVPKSVLNSMEAIHRNFLMGLKITTRRLHGSNRP